MLSQSCKIYIQILVQNLLQKKLISKMIEKLDIAVTELLYLKNVTTESIT